MSNPQQPELARSRKQPHQDQDAVSAVVDGAGGVEASETEGVVPEENQPAHRPDRDQDKPDADEFAARFGITGGDAE